MNESSAGHSSCLITKISDESMGASDVEITSPTNIFAYFNIIGACAFITDFCDEA
jgi:hypothetical protein